MIDKVYFATTNSGKVNSLKRDLGNFGIDVIQAPLDLREPRSSDVHEIAEAKIREAYSKILKPTVVIDAGFYIDSLNGFPRAFTNFALDTLGLEGILKLVEDKPRECEFRECLAFQDERLAAPQYFISQVRGSIAEGLRGSLQPHHWSKLSQIFVPDHSGKTLAEMPYDEYLEWRKVHKDKNSLGRQLGNWITSRQD